MSNYTQLHSKTHMYEQFNKDEDLTPNLDFFIGLAFAVPMGVTLWGLIFLTMGIF